MGDQKIVKDNVSLFWDAFKSVSFAVGIWLFFIGWVYLAYYFKCFGLSIYEIKIDFFSFYLYGFYVAKMFWMAVILGVFLFVYFYIYYKRNVIKNFFILITVSIIVLFPCSFLVASYYAKNEVLEILTGKKQIPPITFSFKQSFIEDGLHTKKDSLNNDSLTTKSFADDHINTVRLINASDNYQLKKFYESNDEHYVFYNPNENDSLISDIQIFIINKKDINYCYLSVGHSSLTKLKKK